MGVNLRQYVPGRKGLESAVDTFMDTWEKDSVFKPKSFGECARGVGNYARGTFILAENLGIPIVLVYLCTNYFS